MTHDNPSPSDDDLRVAVLACFAADKRTASAHLRVGVSNGIVHLAGVVTSPDTWIAAAELAESIPGVRGVVNRIEAPGAPSPARTIHLDLPTSESNKQPGKDRNG